MKNKRLVAWRHNALSGHARMMEAQCKNIISAPTTTPEAKASAARILVEVKELLRHLATRVDT